MRTQRMGPEVSSRRSFLRTAGVVGIGAVAGCLDRGQSGNSASVAILSAGSLQNALEHGLKSAVDVPVQIEAHGSATVARMIDEGQRDPDIVTVADTELFEGVLSPQWYSVFTSNAVVLAYNPDTSGGQRLAQAGPEQWYEPLADGDVSLGWTDPDQDPLGYRTLFTLELASRYYDDATNLREQILRHEQIYPETSLISQFETGSIDAAIAYRNMAVERDYEYIALPDQLDLSNPEYVTDWYSTVSYELPSGQEIEGGLISYGSTIRKMSDAALSVFDVHTTGNYLSESGFLFPDQFPRYEGEVPDEVSEAKTGPGDSQSVGRADEHTLASTVSEITLLV